ncbi:EmrB/QacA family drug resistance transporter [Rhodococcus sp. 15-725-2-2b]|jgi:EmrB/QacA subfamily drug resistance transporter|uniref:MDR family MFS transporter n=1 Tax=Nocardiaceae TaxID=85025 RepID=UPI00050C4C77|nr:MULTISPECIES: MDR family MFS transporter [Rhodococcus]OZC59043.1 EmrB/QacA family drug resistance transporter [Rhodococcus sp. 06-470-2]OZC66411.1 EmrB/QacA family drug resistance transporter [Rhodococcus sp. 06-469-3-2]OZD45058.1 EmrB/QacA family drug resistance transporter [Rhodococcus sp. 06-1477-1A]OZE15563.1 EmrB/QacA family drug resistance transporter [Rhodococcus sp. 05-2255-3B1]OZE16213.1 EmrB/QacA family drug resistance transporter [Rhodococcus sp. 05-2255-3C]
MVTEPEVTPASGEYSHREIMTILSGLMMGMFLAALDQTIVSTSVRTIADDLNGFSVLAWVTTAYLITSTVSTPLYGKLSDLYGRKPFFMTAISIFVVGSMLCGIATSMYELAAFRAIQGLGAGGLMSMALAIIGDIVPPRERAKYQGYFLAVFGTSSVLGPVIGGLLAGQSSILGITGWRWVFYINVPLGIIALVVVWRVLNLPVYRREARVDWWGAVLLSVGLVPLLIIAEQGRVWGWSSPRALLCFGIGIVGVIAFVLAEIKMGDDALIPMRFFRNPLFSLCIAVSVIAGAAMFGGISLLPQYLQVVKGSSPTLAGYQTLPLVGALMVASIVSGRMISKTGRYKIFPIVGTALMALAMFVFHYVHADTPLWQTMVVMGVFGLGLGSMMQPLTLAIQNAMPPKDMGVSTSAATFFRQIGATVGVAVFLSMLFTQLTPKTGDALIAASSTPAFQQAVQSAATSSDPLESGFARAIASGDASVAGSALQDSSFIQKLEPALAEPFRIGFSDAMDYVFLAVSILMVLGFVLVLFLKEVPLRTMSGLAAAQQERDEERANEAGTGLL